MDLFHTLGTFFMPCENLFCFMLCFHFILSTSISYPDHGISYQVAKFSYPQQPISYSFHFPLISLPDSLYVYIHLQLKELVMFADASYDQIMLLSLHPAPRDGCDWHWLHPNARHRTNFHRVFKHDLVVYTCGMLVAGRCGPRGWMLLARGRPPWDFLPTTGSLRSQLERWRAGR